MHERVEIANEHELRQQLVELKTHGIIEARVAGQSERLSTSLNDGAVRALLDDALVHLAN